MTDELLKAGPTELFDWLSQLLQQVWSLGKVPQDWKDSFLVPVFKKNDRQCVTTIVVFHYSVYLEWY